MKNLVNLLVGIVLMGLVGLSGCGVDVDATAVDIKGIQNDVKDIHTQTTRLKNSLTTINDRIASKMDVDPIPTPIPTRDPVATSLENAVRSGYIELGQSSKQPQPESLRYNKSDDHFDVIIGLDMKAKRDVNLLTGDGFKIKLGNNSYWQGSTPFTDVDFRMSSIGTSIYNTHSPVENPKGSGIVNLSTPHFTTPFEMNAGVSYHLTFNIHTSLGARLTSIQMIHSTGWQGEGVPFPILSTIELPSF